MGQFGISCEACHGPAAQHVAAQLAGTVVARAAASLIDPSTLTHDRSAMVCGQCHAVHPFRSPAERAAWKAQGFSYRPGDDLALTRELLRSRPEDDHSDAAHSRALEEHFDELFWPDGEVRVSGREYNGLVESACFQRGELTCISCHEMHPSKSDSRALDEWADDQLAAGMRGSAACLECHEHLSESLVQHTHHAPLSSGSNCLNCHMPHTTYGLTKAIRSHTISSPSVATTLASGRPNACNLCHLDRSLGWTADHLADWYGQQRPELEADREQVSALVIEALTGDAGRRAIAAWAMGWEPAREVSGTGWMPYVLSTLMLDPYDAVARVALVTTRLDPRHASLELDFTLPYGLRGAVVRLGPLADWQRSGLQADPDQAPALLINPDGSLNQARFEQLFATRDNKDVRLAE